MGAPIFFHALFDQETVLFWVQRRPATTFLILQEELWRVVAARSLRVIRGSRVLKSEFLA